MSNLGRGSGGQFENNPNFANLRTIKETILPSDLHLSDFQDKVYLIFLDNIKIVETTSYKYKDFRILQMFQNTNLKLYNNKITRYQCVHHGKREYYHEQGAVKQENQGFDPKSVINYYCGECREFCCEYCIALGPHNNDLHKISFLQTFSERYQDFIDDFLRTSTNEKCMQLFKKIKQINERMELVSNQSQVIERDASIEFTHILERLSLAEGNKISVLQNDIRRLQRDINSIEDCVKAFENLGSRQDRLPFLLFYRSLNFYVTQALSLHLKEEINETPYDLPRELSAIKVQMENYKPNYEILKYKDIIIWNLLEEKQKHLESINVSQSASYQQKLELWTELAKKTFEEFETLQLICHYCGELINEEIINVDCTRNQIFKDRDRSIAITVHSDEVIEKGIYGNKRHYWVKPRLKDRQIKLGQLPNIQIGRKGINRSVAYYNYIKLYQLMFALIKKKKSEKGVNLEDIFKAYDKDRSGHVSVIQFQYVLNTILDLEVDYVERATEFLGTTQKEINKSYGIPDEEEEKKQESTFSIGYTYNIMSSYNQEKKEEIPPEKPNLILQNPAHLEYESFKIIDFQQVKQSGQNHFVQLNEDLYKQCRIDGNTKANQNKKAVLASTYRGGTKYGSSYSNFTSTLRK